MELEPPNTSLGAAYTQAIVDLAEDAIIAVGRDRRILLFNRGAVKTFGFQAAEAIGHSLNILLPQRLLRLHKNHIRDFASAPEAARRMGERGEILGRRKDGSEFPAEASISKAQVAGQWLFTIILRDVTEHKLAQQQIEASLREKEALLIEKEAMLKEIHHRVKNNLQVVSGLLGLQARVIPDQTTRKLFQESQNRIHSMALVHERLYLSQNLSEIDSHEYMSQLAAHLFRAYGVSVSRIKLTINTEATRLSTDAAVSCGLILNELVSNSLKYAFPEGRGGEIRIELRRNGLRPCCLIVADNGVGLPENVTLWSTKSLGLRLVKILADQIGASVQVSSSGGTEVKLMFHEESGEDDTDERILIVEDESITAEYLQAVLTDLGYSVIGIVSKGLDAIAKAERNKPDLVLMDIRLKGKMDGVESARIIRRRFDIPSVYLTAHADLETLSRAKLAEPLGYIVKPFQVPELQATIEMAMHKRLLDREAQQREEQLSATLSATGEGVIWTDAKGAVTFVNPAAQRWTGWKQEDAVGRTIEEVLRLRPSGVRAVFDDVLSQGTLASLDETTSVVGEDGAECAIGGSVAPIIDHIGAIAGVVFVFGEPARESAGNSELLDIATDQDGFAMVVESAAMRQLVSFARRVAKSEASTILIEGESGTGKDILAKYVHYHSDRRAKPFLAVNCAAIPETLLESELFGYEKGAFTDARQQKRGILELASGGTVFLDEVGDMPLGIQAKLLRVLEDQAFRRLGGLNDIEVDLRVITATNRDLREAIQDGRFRLDLYYRVNVIQLRIPPVRERNEDILPLAEHFLRLLNRRFKRQIQGISPRAAEALLAHNWPGNAREIRNTIERAMILEESALIRTASLDIRRDSAPDSQPLASAAVSVPEGMSLNDAERAMLVRALEKANWNQSRAARALSITRDTLRYKMKKYGLFDIAVSAG